MSDDPTPRRRDLWFVNFSPTRGHEQRGDRPALVVSDDRFNESPAGLTIVCPPTTTQQPGIPWHVSVQPEPDSGLDDVSYVMCEQVRTVAIKRFRRRIGRIGRASTMDTVEDRLRVLMQL